MARTKTRPRPGSAKRGASSRRRHKRSIGDHDEDALPGSGSAGEVPVPMAGVQDAATGFGEAAAAEPTAVAPGTVWNGIDLTDESAADL